MSIAHMIARVIPISMLITTASTTFAEPQAPVQRNVKTSTMPTSGGMFDDGGMHIGDCLMRRGGAVIRFYDDGTGDFAADVRSEDSGDTFYFNFWVTDSQGRVVIRTVARTKDLPRSRDVPWRASFTFDKNNFAGISMVHWASGGCS